MNEVAEQLSASVRVEPGIVVLTVVGEVDIATVPHLRVMIDEAVAAGPSGVTVDMAGVRFMDASGLGVLVDAANRLRESGGRLAVRGVRQSVFRVFEVTGLIDTLNVDRPETTSALVRELAGLAAIPHNREVLDAALRLVVTVAQAVVVGADGVSITLPRDGRLGTVAASNDVVLEMDHDQYDTGEGPCLDAAVQGERFHIDSLREEERWPAFVPRARARGIESILSTPLVTSDQPVGALNVYSRTIGAFAAQENAWADQFASEAAILVSSVRVAASMDVLTQQIQEALVSREVIALAQGMVMERDGVSERGAHHVLRDLSRATGQPLRDICDDLVRTHGSGGH